MHLRNRLAQFGGGLPRTFWLLWVGTFINRLGGFVVPFLTLYLTAQRGMSVSRAALMVSLFGLGSLGAGLLGGELADRLGRRPVLLLSFLLSPINLMGLGLARSVTLIAPLILVQGLLTNLYRPAVNAVVADLVPQEDRPRAYGYIYWAINLGFAVAPALAGWLARFDYLLLFFGDALTTFVFGLIVLWWVQETRPPALSAAAALSARARIAGLLAEPLLLAFSALGVLFGTVYMQGNVTLPLAMRAHGLGPAQYGLAISVNGILIVLLGLPASNLAAKWPRFGAMAGAGALLGVGYGLNALADNLPMYAISVAVWTLGEIVGALVAPSIVADLSPPDKRGLYQGVYSAAWGLASFVGPASGGWVLETFGPTTLWLGCLAIGLLVAGACLALVRPSADRMKRAAPSA